MNERKPLVLGARFVDPGVVAADMEDGRAYTGSLHNST